jgi:peptidoglycan/xylan/chitin deacetylase (PgdA/CDA1 family)
MDIASNRSAPSAIKPAAKDSAILTRKYWEKVFAEEDPWKYGASGYERWKFELTLSLLPKARIRQAAEFACAEGHLTALLAPHVEHLLAVDISRTAIRRARARCANCGNVEFRVLNLVDGALPGKLDLIVISEVLFYLPLSMVQDLAPRIARSLNPRGHLLLVHGNLIADDKTRTAFDWGHAFGAQTIGKVFGALDELVLVRELRAPLFTIQLFRRDTPAKKKATVPEIEEVPLPFDIELSPEVEKSIIWDGAVVTRAEALATETVTQVPILMYHCIADDGPPELAPYRVSPASFREQLRYLRRNGFHSITLKDWAESIAAKRPVPGRPVIITFDDGYKDFYENAFPALERANFSATVFVVTEKVGGNADWDALSQPVALMSWEELRAVAARGIAIGSHSASHKDLQTLAPDAVRGEGERALTMLRENLGSDVDMIAFPWGNSDETSRAVLAKCGYKIGLKSWGGPSTLEDDPLELSRIEIEGGDDVEAFARRLKGEVTQASAAEPGPKPEPAPAAAQVGFHASAAPDAQGTMMPIHPEYAHQLASRLDALVGEFVRLQNKLLNDAKSPPTLQKKLANLFALPVTGKVSRTVGPGQEIVSDIQINFQEGANVGITVEPKADHSLSPDTYLNTVAISFAGQSEWLSLEVALEWRELSLAQRFQLCLYAQPSRAVTCEATLRFPTRSETPIEVNLCTFTLQSDERNAIASGDFSTPDFIELDTNEKLHLLLLIDTEADLSMVIHYFNVYFA